MKDLLREGDFFHLFAENLKGYAVFLIDPQGRVASWNLGAERLLGYTATEIVGRDAACLFTPEQIQHDVPARELAMADETGQASDDRWQVRKGGIQFFANGITTAIRDESGTLLGFVK